MIWAVTGGGGPDPVQTREHAVPSDAFVGRAEEVETLRARTEDARTGRGSFVLIGGEPGIGKTRLAQEAAQHATRTGMRALWGSCWPGEGAPAFWPLIQVLRGYGRDPDAAALLAGTAPARDVARLVPDLFPAPPEAAEQALDPDQQRFRLFDSLATVLRKAGDARPLVVVLDDLQWADPSTLAFLDFLAREVRDARVLVIGTFRENDTGPDHPLTRLPHDVHRITLEGLSVPETAALIAATRGSDPGQSVVEATHRRTGGNPFYIREIARLLDGSVEEIPSTVREAVKAGLARLSSATVEALSVASVAGPEFDARVIAQVLGEEPSLVRTRLDEAVAVRVVVEQRRLVGRYAFTHALMRETLFDDLTPATQADLHGRIGDAIEALAGANLEPSLAELAYHFLNGRPDDRPKAAEFSVRAGEHALGQVLYADALEHFARALDVIDDEDRRPALLVMVGDAAVRAGAWPRATEAFMEAAELARTTNRAEDLARAALGLGAGLGGFEVRLFDQRQIDLLEEALRAGDRELELLARRFRVEALFQTGDIPALDAEIEAYARLAEILRQPISQWYVPLFRGARALLEGRYRDSERLAGQALEMGERAHSTNARMMADFTQLTEAFRQSGRFEDMEVQWQRFVEAFPEMASVADWIAFALATVGQGDQAKARADLERLTASGMLTGLGAGGMWIVMTVFIAEVAAGVRSTAAAEVLYEALRPFGTQFVICGTAGATYGSVWRHLALLADVLGRTGEAAEHFERAIEAHRAAGALPYLAHTQREYAAMLLARRAAGDAERADGLLAEAIDTYQRLGMGPWLERAEALRAPSATRSQFRRDGDVWEIAFAGRAARVRDSKGLRDIAHLLARPGGEVHCSELIAAGEHGGAGSATGRVPSDSELAEAGLAVQRSGGDEILDPRAREEYRIRLVELREELEDAEAANDPERAVRARAEMDFLTGELAAAYGLGGRPRTAGDPNERARKAVTERVRAAIARVSDAHPALGLHLANSIRTGTFCSYRPEAPVDWTP